MPFFSRKSGEGKQAEDAQKQQVAEQDSDRAASLTALAEGGIPVQARRRLEELQNQTRSCFTSDLTVNEFLLARQAGFRPLSQVMGSSIYHVGWQYMPSGGFRSWVQSQELQVVSQAFNDARFRALNRLEQEARLIGADAVVGVHVTRAQYDWGTDLIEFNTVGTAVRLKEKPTLEKPALTNLSGQDFWTLYRSGYWPLGVVAGSTVYYVVASWQTQYANNSWGRWSNTELQDFTMGVQRARHLAMGRIYDQSHSLGASGVVGVVLEQDQEEHEVSLGNDQERTDMIFTFHALGTAIAELSEQRPVPPVHQTITLS